MSYAPTGLRTAGRPRNRSTFSTSVSSFLKALGRGIELWANRRAIHRLAALDDRYLKDIGVSRGDVHWALSHPWHVDPSIVLSTRVERRKSAARWARRF